MVAERSPTPVPLRLRSRSGPGFPPAPHIIRVSTRGRVRHGEGDPGTSSTDVLPSSLRRYRSRHTGNWETATPFFLTLRVENREAALTSDLDHVQFLSRDDHDRLRAFIDEHYPSEEAADVHRDIMRVRENFEEIRRNMVRRRQAEEERRQRLGEAWLARLSRPRRGAVLRYLPRSPCTICFEDDPVNPVGCESCNQLIGCSACVGKWFGTSNCSELDTNVSVGSNDNHSKCPLCRFPWEREPAVFSATCDPRRKK
ncbi:hypothetical protein QR680_017359 [Steinernema hermaphroditum]|uniref:RING-type domain-containing protein n=1 Tax=Steinernema hermaphroditum TaxID=289476 RepID=A0AA39HE95_9BILA|nr:hypothetical protein QR680_017359 [Steinernema hermaphroditum]